METSQIPFPFLDTLLKQQNNSTKHLGQAEAFQVRGLITSTCSKAQGCAGGALPTPKSFPCPTRGGQKLLLIFEMRRKELCSTGLFEDVSVRRMQCGI